MLIVKCPRCGTEKIYKPVNLEKLPEVPRSRCSKCSHHIRVPIKELDEAIARFREKEARDEVREIGSKKKGKKNRSSPPTFVPAEPKRSHNKSASEDLLEGMTDLEILHFHYRKKIMTSNPDLRVLDSFRQFLKELDEFEKAKTINVIEIEENLKELGVEELVELALGNQPVSFSLDDESKESSLPSDSL